MPAKYSPEVKTKTVRLVRDHRKDYRWRVGSDQNGRQTAGDDPGDVA